MKRSLWSPKWLAFHALIVVLVVVMINLGLWQLQRLDERKEFNAEVRSHSATAVQPFDELISQSDDYTELEWYPVRVEGEYMADYALTIVNRSQDGAAGRNSVVPLRTNDGEIVLVNRGFIPLSIDVPPTPTGPVTVIGYARASQQRSAVGAVDSDRAGNTEFQRIDIPVIERSTTLDVAPMYIQRLDSEPAEGQWPARVANPPLDEGPHLSYAGQWFFFTAVAIGGWLVVVLRFNKPRKKTPTQQPIAGAQE